MQFYDESNRQVATIVQHPGTAMARHHTKYDTTAKIEGGRGDHEGLYLNIPEASKTIDTTAPRSHTHRAKQRSPRAGQVEPRSKPESSDPS